MKISIITPSYNRSCYLDETIESVLSQEGDFEIEYIIQDGGSGQDVLDILREWDRKVKSKEFLPKCNNIDFKYFVEKDEGMYDAVNKGFARASGEIMSWLNSDDFYIPHAFNTLVRVFEKFKDVDWVTGMQTLYNQYGGIIQVNYSNTPAYSREFIKRGYYDRRFMKYDFSWIQQETTFWRRSLWEKAGGKIKDGYKLAGDFALWKEFAQHTDLVHVYSVFAGIRKHNDQKTANLNEYFEEIPLATPPSPVFRFIRTSITVFPFSRKVFFHSRIGKLILKLLGQKKQWYLGRVIRWNLEISDWHLFQMCFFKK